MTGSRDIRSARVVGCHPEQKGATDVSRNHIDLDGSDLIVERGAPTPSDLTIVERKGYGHPDTIADHLAERLSRAYSRYTLHEFGVVLHHNFDKLCLLGGSSEVRYRSGRMVDPVRVLVNGRAARSCGGAPVPVDDLIAHEVTAFFSERLPELGDNLVVELNVTTNPSPAAARAERIQRRVPR